MINVIDYGADPTGISDCTTAFQNALNSETACTVSVPKGNYLFTGHLIIPPGVQLVGDRRSSLNHSVQVGSSGIRPSQPAILGSGAILMPTEGASQVNGTPFITVGANAVLEGIQFYYPNQPDNVVPPTPYPFTIDFAVGGFGCLRNLSFANSYQAIRCIGHDAPTIKDVVGQAFYRGLVLDDCEDVAKITDVEWRWDLSTQLDGSLLAWQKENGIAFDIGRVDEALFTRCFAYSYWRGWYLHATPSGAPWCSLVQCGADNCGGNYNDGAGIYIAACQSYGVTVVAFFSTGTSLARAASGLNIQWVASNGLEIGSPTIVLYKLFEDATQVGLVAGYSDLSTAETAAHAMADHDQVDVTIKDASGATVETVQHTTPPVTPYTLWNGNDEVGNSEYDDLPSAEVDAHAFANMYQQAITIKDANGVTVETITPAGANPFSVLLDGSTGYVSQVPFTVGSSGTLSAWVKPTAAALANGAIFRAIRNSPLSLLDLVVASGTLYAGWYLGGTADARLAVPASAHLTAGVWSLVKLSWSPSGTVLKIDGATVASNGASAVWDTALADAIAWGWAGTGGQFFWSGNLDSVVLPVSALEFDEGSGTTVVDGSGNGHDGTLHGGVTWSSDVHGG